MESEDPDGNTDSAPNHDLSLIPEKQYERCQEVAEDQAHAHPPPTIKAAVKILFTYVIPEGFLRYVGTVNQEILRKANVSPEYSEGQHHAGDVITVRLFEDTFQVAFAGKDHSQNNN